MNNTLTENNYVFIPGFISPEAAKALSENFTHFCENNNLGGDEQVSESSSYYNYIDFLELLCNSTPAVGEFIGENVLPTYNYARVYKKGSDLKIHKDRDACEISLTVHLEGDKEWPIYIKNPKGETISLNLKSGDAMLYLGCEAEHWRNVYEGEKYVQVFLHYVRSRGEKAYAFFDREKDKKNNENKSIINNDDTRNNDTVDNNENCFTYVPIIHKLTSKNNLEDFIKIFDNIVPESVCDEIVNIYDKHDLVYASVGKEGVVFTESRKVLTASMSALNESDDNYTVRKKLDDTIHNCLFKALEKYCSFFPLVNIEGDSGFDFLKYRVGDFYKEHIDNFTQLPRTLSVSIALNDDFEGGEFAFFDSEIKYSLKKGSVIMFPSTFMYPHQILPVTKGTRYSIVTWMR